MTKKTSELLRKILQTYYKVKRWDWNLIMLGIISIEVAILVFLRLNLFNLTIDTKSSLELILTINGLFSAILVTYFFNRISRTLDSKKEDYNDAVIFSQKITDFRRILKRLTDFYGVWQNDESTKGLFLTGKYKNVDYFDFKLASISDYNPADKDLLNELYDEPRYHEGQSDLFLGMISLVEYRKNQFKEFDPILFSNYLTKGVYTLKFISNCVEIDYAGRLAYWFRSDYEYIRFNNLSRESKQYILDCLERIDSKKFLKAELNNNTMREICEDMNEHYFKELYQLLVRLNQGLSSLNFLIYLILILCLVFGVLLPFLTYFIFEESSLKTTVTELLIGINFALLFFFITSLYSLVKKEITWT